MTTRRVGFAHWRSELPSGGNRYDDEIGAALKGLGIDLREYSITGSWPFPEHDDRQQLAALLSAERQRLIGNIVGSEAPEAIAAAVSDGRRVTMLVLYFPADDPTLAPSDRARIASTEAAAVTAASPPRSSRRCSAGDRVTRSS